MYTVVGVDYDGKSVDVYGPFADEAEAKAALEKLEDLQETSDNDALMDFEVQPMCKVPDPE